MNLVFCDNGECPMTEECGRSVYNPINKTRKKYKIDSFKFEDNDCRDFVDIYTFELGYDIEDY